MSITTLIFKIDKRLKEEAKQVAREMGVPLSSYLNEQIRELVVRREAHFRAPLVPNKRTAVYLRQAIKDADKGKNMSPKFTSVDEAITWLESSNEN